MNKQPQNEQQPKNVVDVDAGTLLFWVVVIILLPLLITGFWAH